jgi:hypothetical protein
MNILQATQSYEKWMRDCTTIVETHLRHKHAQMKAEVFGFFRGTYYRWGSVVARGVRRSTQCSQSFVSRRSAR